MNDVSLSIARSMFHLQIYESDGQRFEDLFSKIMYYKSLGFQQVKPYGNVGDRKNDGFIRNENTYYQVYAPEDASNNILTAVKKIRSDFNGLLNHWHDVCPIKKFYFVLNDKYKGSLPQLHREIMKLQIEFNLVDAGVLVAKDLEFDLFNLRDDMILSVVGHIPHIDNEEYMFVSGFTCFISAWINFEKTARKKVFSINPNGRTLIIRELMKILWNSKIVSELDLNFIMDISKKRNLLVHGDSMVIPKKSEIDHLITITEKIQCSS
ncbi:MULTISPECIES: hypothetical protein [Pectobacterium]|uniref:hypothetical protein n=1 Tax=Pectobacterium TaxID=122277 RepID=UPI0002E2CC1E|nr:MULTISPECIES: hypothetical protein [Pectobacterium]KFX10139.1 hypothetical protein KP17_20160 [Pectobacterium parvum]MCL6354354.1 hypothetical protein [Pectobacterium parmentieri]MCL6381638.1 hypothetical protein [Pectobacterium parmentieri]QLL92810.1 hypothetical protein HER17_07620 [Pectobacterium carotovorum]GKW36699.1 hypothetical protein PEC301875_07230 [Pectobacterium carotovorum subsp. carotovorum]